MNTTDDIQDFVALCERSNFQSRDEILDGIRSEKYELTHHSGIGVPARSMLDVYKRRSRHVRQFAVNSKHATQMVSDIDAFVRELENAIDDEIKLWRLSIDGVRGYSIFEGTMAERILGCIYWVDRGRSQRQNGELFGVRLSDESRNRT